MSRKNKVVYSNIQPNTKEAGVWVNTNDGNIKIEKDGKWIDDGGGIPEQITLHMDCNINGQYGNYEIHIVDGVVHTLYEIQEHVKSVQSTDNSCTIHLNGGISDIQTVVCLYIHPIDGVIDSGCDRFEWDTAAYSDNGTTFAAATDFEDIIDSSMHIFLLRYNPKEETFYTLTLICDNADDATM